MTHSRREFIVAGGSVLISARWPNLSQAQAYPIWWFVRRFAASVGTSVIANGIYDYLKSRANQPIADEIRGVNDTMAKGGFTDLSRSRVYATGRYFFYPAVARDAFNTCVPFLDRARGTPAFITMMEGPTLYGLSHAARDVADARGIATAADVFLPQEAIEKSIGSFESGYQSPDVYRSKAALVNVGYRRAGFRRGIVDVAVRDHGNQVLLDKSYELRYSE